MKAIILLALFSVNVSAMEEISVLNELAKCKPERVLLDLGNSLKIFEKNGLKIVEKSKGTNFDIYFSGRKEIYKKFSNNPSEFKAIVASFLDDDHKQYAIVAHKNSKISSLSDLNLKNLVLEMKSGGARQHLVKDVLGFSDEKKKKTQFKEINVGPNFKLNQETAIYIREPELSLLLANNPNYKIIVDEPILKSFFKPWPMAYYAVSKNLIKNKPEQLQKVLKSFTEIIASYKSNPKLAKDSLNECMSKKYGVENSNVRLINFWNYNEFNLDIIQKQVNLYYNYKLMEKPFSGHDLVYKNSNITTAKK